MYKIQFNLLTDEESIAKNMHIHGFKLVDLITGKTDDFYEKLLIPKHSFKNNGHRLVYKPNYRIEGFHKDLLMQINYNSDGLVHECSHGFVKGKSILTNANAHLDKKYLLQMDIKSFFSSVSKEKVRYVFEKLGCNNYIAEIFSDVCTIDGFLAEGLNTSPAIANIYFYHIDEILVRLADNYSCIYTRYADDLTFSSNIIFDYKKLTEDIEKVLNKEGLELNKNKTRFNRQGQAQYVTGLSISNDIRPRIPKKIKRRLRQELYFIKKYGFEEHFDYNGENLDKGYNRLNGWLLYSRSVEPEYFKKLNFEYKKLK
ncbi:reverse transcriptase family protein [Halarcobacter sp.]|uniref:reverse transcriptase family protein n=1 Tax=Halarcobacter sp. TaxID=2321133 RepID=UPI0029F51DEB|nr:reverse transcriptase family protein [Halarcobacter sp.]